MRPRHHGVHTPNEVWAPIMLNRFGLLLPLLGDLEVARTPRADGATGAADGLPLPPRILRMPGRTADASPSADEESLNGLECQIDPLGLIF
jgi:hypothetical protein